MPWRLLAACLLAAVAATAAADAPVAPADARVLLASGVAADAKELLRFFRDRTAEAEPEAVRTLVRKLGDDSFAVREEATRRLARLAGRATPFLRPALDNPDPEVRRRAAECLRLIERGEAPGLAAAAARALAARNPPGAAEALLAFLSCAADAATADAVRAALADLAVADDEADPVLVRGLADAEPARRAAAASALVRAGATEHLAAARKLLDDPEPEVRLHVALALAGRGDKDAVPPLIAVLDALPRAVLWEAEEFLYRVAEEKAPSVPPGTTPAQRSRYRDAWAAWWREHSAAAAVPPPPKPFLDRTLIVLLDENRVVEFGPDDRPLWQMTGLGFPLDVQTLPGERLLVAENGASRVTVRHRSGAVLWEKIVPTPLMAQRLDNGHTFIGGRTELLEVDRDGDPVFAHRLPDGEEFMRAARLPDGDVAYVVTRNQRNSEQRFVRLDPSGKERSSFAVQVHTLGGRIDVGPDGSVLVPSLHNHKVVEYDARGKELREFAVHQPIAAVRLANGHTLITSGMPPQGFRAPCWAFEFDAAGKRVWAYRNDDSKVTRAFRR